jgi:hypothetical protein
MIASKQQRFHRAVVMQGIMKLDKDASLEVVTEQCVNDSGLEAITKMANLATDELENCLAKEIVRRMGNCKAYGEDDGYSAS